MKTMVYGAIYLAGFAFILYANVRRHRQLRRLERMHREWREQEERDLADEQ